MNILNQFSYPLIGIGVLAISYITMTRYLQTRWYVTTATQGIIAGVFILGFVVLRPGMSNVDSVDQALKDIGNGRPTLVAFFSNYCTGCLALNPFVDEIEADLQGAFNILRIDIHTPLGRQLRQELGFSFTPEFVLYDAGGDEVWRDHVPPSSDQIDSARN
jgi:thiol-disulfide isomerase/thioredoxin